MDARRLGIGLFASLFVVAACGGGDDTNTVGESGGTVVSDDGVVTVTIPAGALSEDVEIGIAPAADAEGYYEGLAYELTPHDLRFAERVTLEIRLDALPEDTSRLRLAKRHDNGQIEIWGDSTLEGNTLSATIDTFSTHGAWRDAAAECFDIYMDSDNRTVVIDREGTLLAVERARNNNFTVDPSEFSVHVRPNEGTAIHRDVLSGDAAMYWYRKPNNPCITRIAFFGTEQPNPNTCEITVQAWRETIAPEAAIDLMRNTVAHMSPSAACLTGVTQPDITWFELVGGDGGQPMPVVLGGAPSWQHWLRNQTTIRMVVAETAGGGSETVHEVEQSFSAPNVDFITVGIGPLMPVPVGTPVDFGVGDAAGQPILLTRGGEIGAIQFELWREDGPGQYTFIRDTMLSGTDVWPAVDNGTAALPAGRYFMRTRSFNLDLTRTISVNPMYPLNFE